MLVFDGDCGFCSTSVRLLERIGPEAEVVPWQQTDLAPLGVTAQSAAEALQWIGVDGEIRSGHEAVAAVLGTAGPAWRLAGRALLLPGFAWIAARSYRLIADNRYRLPGGTPACARPPAPRP